MPDIVNSAINRRKGNIKVKTGCRTCKIRKIKCDERFPACLRCTSTNRICGGYGIWGGGRLPSDGYQKILAGPMNRVAGDWPPAALSIFPFSDEDKVYFDWFKCRTATKLPGSFVSSFWTSLLLQSSLSEPAVLHAVLALSSVHKTGSDDSSVRSPRAVKNQEQFTLQHYVKAIGHLQSHFSNKNRASCRVALIACIVFISIDLLRGYFDTAQLHLQNGLKILEEMQMLSSVNDGILHSNPRLVLTEDWIVEAFSRLNLQVELFRHGHYHSCQVLHIAGLERPVFVFKSANEAWQQLERLLNSIFFVTRMAYKQGVSDSGSSHTLLEKQRLIRRGLTLWLRGFNDFMRNMKGLLTPEEAHGYRLLYPYHTMATIMVETCLRPRDEMAFDSHTDEFLLLLEQCAKLAANAPSVPSTDYLPAHAMLLTRFIIDMGWIPLLYYVATKCRIHRIRLQAIKLLEFSPHREGFWDAKIAAYVARKVMNTEEMDHYKDYDTAENFSLSSLPGAQDFLLPAIPMASRLREIEVVLSGGPLDKILLFYYDTIEGVDCRILLSHFDLGLQCWVDGSSGETDASLEEFQQSNEYVHAAWIDLDENCEQAHNMDPKRATIESESQKQIDHQYFPLLPNKMTSLVI